MSNLALFFTLAFIVLTMFLSIWQKVGLEKEILIGTIRAALQLIGIGYVLHFIFNTQSWLFIGIMLSIMILVASLNAARKWNELQGIRIRMIFTLFITEVVTMGLILVLGIIKPSAQYIIPISGMIIGNGMVTAGLFLNRLKAEIETRMDELKIYLSLGATSSQAIRIIRKNTVKSSMIPVIDSMKTVGLVQLPGMMTGMIVAGASPIEAVRYQLLIMYSLTSAAALTTILLATLVHGLLFTHSHQFKVLPFLKK